MKLKKEGTTRKGHPDSHSHRTVDEEKAIHSLLCTSLQCPNYMRKLPLDRMLKTKGPCNTHAILHAKSAPLEPRSQNYGANNGKTTINRRDRLYAEHHMPFYRNSIRLTKSFAHRTCSGTASASAEREAPRGCENKDTGCKQL